MSCNVVLQQSNEKVRGDGNISHFRLGFFVLWHINPDGLFDAKAIIGEELQ